MPHQNLSINRFYCVTKGAPATEKLFTGVLSDIKNSYLAVMNTNASTPVGFRFFACREKSSAMFKTAEEFRKLLEHQATLYQHPILIR